MNKYAIVNRTDLQREGVTVLLVREAGRGTWTLISSAEGTDLVVDPTGELFDGFMVDSRDSTPQGELFAWLGDQVW